MNLLLIMPLTCLSISSVAQATFSVRTKSFSVFSTTADFRDQHLLNQSKMFNGILLMSLFLCFHDANTLANSGDDKTVLNKLRSTDGKEKKGSIFLAFSHKINSWTFEDATSGFNRCVHLKKSTSFLDLFLHLTLTHLTIFISDFFVRIFVCALDTAVQLILTS